MAGIFRPGCLVQLKDGRLGQLQSCLEQSKVFLLDGEIVTASRSELSSPSSQKPIQGGDEASFDLALGPQTSDEVATQEISQCLFEKGFAVLRLCQPRQIRERAVEAMQRLAEDGTLGRLPEEVEEGYLGLGGKGRVTWLDPDRLDVETEALHSADQNLSYLASLLQPASGNLFDRMIKERTPALAALSLDIEEEEDYPHPEADDQTLGDFLGTWRRGLVKAVHFMGPDTASIELETREGPKAAALPTQQEVIRLKAEPNTIILFRPDCYNFSWSVEPESEVLMLTASFLSEAPRWLLRDWSKMDTSKWLCMGGVIAPHGPPPPKGNGINVLHLATRLPSNADEPEMYTAFATVGCDAVVEIPISRFDYDQYYTDDFANVSPLDPKMTQKHTSLVEGVELFDNKYFDISNNEALNMDPIQRQVCEVGGALLLQHGISKKVSNKTSSHAGFAVGVDKADFAAMGLGGGGTNAYAIIANRFSFVFNMKGPNFVADTACSASGTALHLAKPLLLDQRWDPLEWFAVLGTHLCLSPGPWIGTSMSSMSSVTGRSFTFDASANGYLRGEGTSGILLKYGEYDSEGVIFRSSQVGQDGRSASLTAPNGPAQEDIIRKAIREGGMTSAESTSWECHGTGTSLGDPIEVGAVRKVQLKVPRQEPLMMSTCKSNIGHLEGGAAMAAMLKGIVGLKYSQCLPSNHLRQLNPHLEHTTFDAFFETERSRMPFDRANTHVSSFGFGGTNAHIIFWGKSMVNKEDTRSKILRRIARMSPAEIRPVGQNPDHWEADLPDENPQAGESFGLVLNPEDPIDEPMRWLKVSAHEQADSENDAQYVMTGNFNIWQQDAMEPGTVPGSHSIVLLMPSDGKLEFRFLRNGNFDEVIAPATAKCSSKLGQINGPEADLTNTWLIEGQANSRYLIELLCLKGNYSITWRSV
eukprot:TRINITY_DN3882_c0_g1_i1.p1 TRINITY_DN3882_c0_g1~~TRINITY_DN3882_c0_g1_i1.p1  ORF type:complete len:929 (+),score=159.98 TRINITY_DN3882_c0_g1_i1:33-2819(+)